MLALDLVAMLLVTALFGWAGGQNANAQSDAERKDYDNHGAE